MIKEIFESKNLYKIKIENCLGDTILKIILWKICRKINYYNKDVLN